MFLFIYEIDLWLENVYGIEDYCDGMDRARQVRNVKEQYAIPKIKRTLKLIIHIQMYTVEHATNNEDQETSSRRKKEARCSNEERNGDNLNKLYVRADLAR